MRQERQHLRSTQTSSLPLPHSKEANITTNETPNIGGKHDNATSHERTHCVFMKPIAVTGQIHSDQTGRFPITSSRGSKYIMVVYDYDSNAILTEPLTSRTETELLRAYSKLHDYLTARGLKPALQRLDNEAPGRLQSYMRAKSVTFQLVPPHNHRRNAAEKAIGTWKDHFIAGLSSLDPNFPMHLWCRLIPQATTTLNLLRQSHINPRLSAEAQLNGAFDFNTTPLAPPGTRVVVHEKTTQRGSWDTRAIDGWYLGPAPKHHPCYRVSFSKTASERNSETVSFFPYNCPMPKTSSADAASAAATALIHALRHPAPASPFPNLGDDQLAALDQLAAIFQTVSGPSTEPPPRVESNEPPQPTSAHRYPLRSSPAAPIRSEPTSPRLPVSAPTPAAPTHRYPLRSTQHSANSATSDLFAHVHQANTVVNPITGQVQEYRHLLQGPDAPTWTHSFANELGRLSQGVGTRMPSGTETIWWIRKHQVPSDRKVTYGRIVATIRPQKSEPHRTRLTVGGDRLDYPGAVSTPTAKLTTAKCLLNSTISTADARFMVADIKDFYLNTPMERYEYMRLPLSIIPDKIVDQYSLKDLVTPDGWVYIEIRKRMYGIKQAGLIANVRLTAHLAKYGYAPTPRTPGLWRHHTCNISFCLVIDDFGVKYVGQHNADHLVKALQNLYTISTDWKGELYCGLTIKWNYPQKFVDISMPDYVPAALHKFRHDTPTSREDAPHKWTQPAYGAKIQYAPDLDSSTPLNKSQVTRLQQVIGTLLYYSIAVDPTMLVALGTIAAAQSNATDHTATAVVKLLNYAATNPDAVIRYKASGMTLYVHSDASYLSEPKAHSRAGGHFYLSDKPADPASAPSQQPPNNGPLHTTSHILRNVMASAAESEVGALFVNSQEAIPLRYALEELGHPQPPTPVQTDNSTAAGYSNNTIKQKRSKAMDMRFSWLQCRERQRQFIIYWRPGSENLGDYHTKHHSASHHRKMRPQFLQPTKTTQPISRKTFTPCEGVLMQPFTDAQQTHYVPQTNCSWSNESRTQKLLHSLGKATRRLANSSLSY